MSTAEQSSTHGCEISLYTRDKYNACAELERSVFVEESAFVAHEQLHVLAFDEEAKERLLS